MSTPSNNADTVAMSLWQRFSDLQKAMDTARAERQSLTAQLNLNQLHAIQRERQQHRDELSQSLAQHATWTDRLTALQEQWRTTWQPQRQAATQQKYQASAQYAQWQADKAATFQNATEQSRAFRLQTKRLRLNAGVWGLSPMRAAIVAAVGD